jgi:hypothetical protein
MNLTITEKRSQQGYGRHNRFALILLVLAAVWLGAPTLPAEAVDFDQHQVNFMGVQYDDPATGQSTWFYEVIDGSAGGPGYPTISHVTFAISACTKILVAGTWAGPNDFNTRYPGQGNPIPAPPGVPVEDPTSGITGLKFNEQFELGETKYFYFTLRGNHQVAPVTMAINAAGDITYGEVELPSPNCVRGGIIGDRVWLDRNADGEQDPNEPGIQGIPVTLRNADNLVIAHTVTGVDGYYLFYVPAGMYTVVVTPPPGMTQTYDADGLDSPHQSTVSIGDPEPWVNLEQDFGYWFGDDPEDEVRLDLGDLPEGISGLPDYPTFFVSGAAHVVFPDTDNNGTPNSANGRPAIWLGAGIDVEPDGQPDALAAGDNFDDGLSFAATGWNPGGSSTMTVSLNSDVSGTTAYFGIWIDWTLDGVFDAFYSGFGTAPGNIDVLIAVPNDYASTNVYIRVRAHDAPLGAADYQGTLVNGEVEDYIVRFSPTAVTLTSITATTQASMPLLAIILLTALVLFSTSVLIQRRQAVAVN